MKEDFIVHNLFWKGIEQFEKFDPHLSRLEGLPFVHHSSLEDDIPVLTPGIYILTGSRQVGKTTLLKLIIKKLLLEKHLEPDDIFYLPCDTISDFKQLLFELEQFRPSTDGHFVLFIDEVTYVSEWDRAIKSLADAGFFSNGSVVITGSDSYLLKEAMMRFPGRRGSAPKQDFHLYPLSFFEYVEMKDAVLSSTFLECRKLFDEKMEFVPVKFDAASIKTLYHHFSDYLITGGFMPAINDFAKNKNVPPATYKVYVQWILGDVLKRGKQETYLKEIISALIRRLTKQITWHNLSADMSIEHHKTVADYVGLLCRMDATFVLSALKEDKLLAAPKKAKKIGFADPFIFHAMHGWIKNENDSFKLSNELLNKTSDLKNALIEQTISSLFNRDRQTFYIKAEGEVDIAIVSGKKFLPIEIKNSLAIDRKDLKQILKYKNGIVGYAGFESRKFEHLTVIPIPALAMLA